MACLDAHIDKAVHNISTMAHLATDPAQKDWVATVAFYVGLHIVDAVLYSKNKGLHRHGQSHNNREQLVKTDRQLAEVWKCYWPLHNESIVARYLQFAGTPAEQHISFDRRMPDAKFIDFLKVRLGGLVRSAARFLPREKAQQLQTAFNSQLSMWS